MCILADDTKILATEMALPAGASGQRVEGIITPGFVDLQVNGGGGVLLNYDPTAQGMAAIAAAHRKFGTVAILPTVITDAPEVLAAGVDAALGAQGMDGIAGLHIEGPHIAEARRGTHAARFIRPLDDGTIAQVTKLRAAGIAVMITVAPEAAAPALADSDGGESVLKRPRQGSAPPAAAAAPASEAPAEAAPTPAPAAAEAEAAPVEQAPAPAPAPAASGEPIPIAPPVICK